MTYDIVIIGASFAGLTLAHHLPKHLKVLVLDMKSSLDHHIESTGLITQKTRDLLGEFMDVDKFIPNRITTIGVVAPNYRDHFFSHMETPWIYSTDTPALVRQLSEDLPDNVDLKIRAQFTAYHVNKDEPYPVKISMHKDGKKHLIAAKFIVGADGAVSPVSKANPNLSSNKKFLAGIEKVYYGDITFGEHPENCVYHFWFGKFSLGYGGWLSPTVVNGKPAFRLGIAKHVKDAKGLIKIKEFVKILEEKGMIKIADRKELLTFSSMIPIGGPLRKPYDEHSLLLGDAAGLCGAFAADGIKGAIVSAQVAARLIPEVLDGDPSALKRYYPEIQKNNKLMTYYYKQLLYRFIWDRMKSDRSFHLLYKIIARAKESFLEQFCDSKDRHKSLVWIVLKVRNFPLLVRYSFSLVLDLIPFLR